MERKCASELPSPCRNFTSGINARSALVRSAGTSGSAFSLTEIAHVVCGVTTVQMPSPSVRSASARCTSSVMMTICSRALVLTVNALSRTALRRDRLALRLLGLHLNSHSVERAVHENHRDQQENRGENARQSHLS